MSTSSGMGIVQQPRWRIYLAIVSLSALLAGPPVCVGSAEVSIASASSAEVRFAFSRTMFAGVNESDAKAAIKVYSQVIGGDQGIAAGEGPRVLDGIDAIADALRLNQVDLLSITAPEFFALEEVGLTGPLMLTTSRESCTEEYVLLAHEKSDVRKVEDLKGRSLILSSEIRASLAPLWLDVLCQERDLGTAEQALGKIAHATKATQVVLPVFFRKADACVVTRKGWEVMGELNPQVKNQLCVLAASQPVVPAVTCFRRGFSETLKMQIIGTAEASASKPSFKQLMALFKTDGLAHKPLTALASTRELVARHATLRAAPSPERDKKKGGGT